MLQFTHGGLTFVAHDEHLAVWQREDGRALGRLKGLRPWADGRRPRTLPELEEAAVEYAASVVLDELLSTAVVVVVMEEVTDHEPPR